MHLLFGKRLQSSVTVLKMGNIVPKNTCTWLRNSNWSFITQGNSDKTNCLFIHLPFSTITAILGAHPGGTPKPEEVQIPEENIRRNVIKSVPHDIMLLKLPKAYPQFTTIQLPPSTCQTPVLKENVRIAGWSYTEGEKHTELSDAQEPTCRIYIIFSNLNSTGGRKPEKLQCSKSGDLQVTECYPTEDAQTKIQMRFCAAAPGKMDACHVRLISIHTLTIPCLVTYHFCPKNNSGGWLTYQILFTVKVNRTTFIIFYHYFIKWRVDYWIMWLVLLAYKRFVVLLNVGPSN